MRRYLPIYLLLLLSFVMGMYLFVRLRSEEKRATENQILQEDVSDEKKVEALTNPILRNEDIPIQKGLWAGKGFYYDVVGKIVELDTKERMDGYFVMEGDPLERRWFVQVGNGGSKTYLGLADGDFDGSTDWKMQDNSMVRPILLEGGKVQLRILYLIDLDFGMTKHQKKMEGVLDELISEYERGNFSMEIPGDFIGVVSRVKIIEE